MRPLQRPTNSNTYTAYKKYKPDLLKAFGGYCTYCEKKDGDLDIEHVEPTSKGGGVTDWNNLLLGCPSCNRDFKKAKNLGRAGYAFPDTNETFAIFRYHDDGRIDGITDEAQATIKLCGLDRDAPRFSNRTDAIWLADRRKKELLNNRITAMDVVEESIRHGHWSIWMTVFHDVPEVIALLSDPKHFLGTRPQFQKPHPPI